MYDVACMMLPIFRLDVYIRCLHLTWTE